MALTDDLRAAYSSTGRRWEDGPARIYERLAEELLACCPVAVAGATVADIGAGTGAGGRAARRAGAARVVALDVAAGMLLADPDRPPSAVADARALPLRDGGVDVALAAFSLNHLTEPEVGLQEAARVVRPGGAVVVGAYAADDSHPAKGAAEQALRRHGWGPPAWADRMREQTVPRLASVIAARQVAAAAGLPGATVEHHRLEVTGMDAAALVGWRMGMAQHAPFLATLDDESCRAVVADAVALLGEPPPLVRSVVVITAVV